MNLSNAAPQQALSTLSPETNPALALTLSPESALRRHPALPFFASAILALSAPAFSQAVPAANGAVTLTVSSATAPTVSSVPAGTAITLTASVSGNGARLTRGMVRFCDAAVAPRCTHENKIGHAQLTAAGIASAKFTPGPGIHTYSAVFYPQWQWNSSTSAAQTLNVTTVGSSVTTLAQAGAAPSYSLSANVSFKGNGSTPATGSVSFVDTSANNRVLGTVALGPAAATGITNPVAGLVSFLPTTIPTGPIAGLSAVAAADFRGKGRIDLATVGVESHQLTILLNNGDGTYTPTPVSPTTMDGTYQIRTADFNQDGIPDLALTNLYNNDVEIFLGNGDGTFKPMTSVYAQNGTDNIVIADFNKDGIPDLLVTNRYSGTVSFLAGKGDGTFTPGWSAYVTSYNPTSIVAADFNGDGNMGFAATSLNGNAIEVYTGNGDGTFNFATEVPVGTHPGSIVAGDFNGDGVIDLAVTNLGDNTVSILLGKSKGKADGNGNNGNGNGNGNGKSKISFDVQPPISTPAGTYDLAAADFNGDGKLDLVVSSTSSNSLTYLFGAGDGTFPTQNTVAAGTNPYQLTVADFNSDGVPDVAVADNANTATVFLTHPAQTTGTATLTNVPLVGTGNHLVEAIYSGDLNYGTSASSTVSLLAEMVPTRLNLFANPMLLMAGQQSNLTARLSPYSNFSQGSDGQTVTFYSDGKAIGTSKLVSGQANFFSNLPAGFHILTAAFAGTSTLAPSSGLTFELIFRPWW